MSLHLFVTTATRVGSTWLCDLVSSLTGVPWQYWQTHEVDFRRLKKQIASVHPSVIKMHRIDPRWICPLLEDGESGLVLNITRDIRDALVSKLFYERYDRFAGALRAKRMSSGQVWIVDQLVEELKALPDRQFINRVVQSPAVKALFEEHLLYLDFNHSRYWHTTYEALTREPMDVATRLCAFLDLSPHYS